MMKRIASLLLVATLSACALAPHASDADDPLAQFLDWFPGRYDSGHQQWQEAATGTPEAERNYRRHSIFRRVDLPAFGDIVFLAHQYRDGDPDTVYRQRLYTFARLEGEDAFRLRVHVPTAADALRGAYRDPSRLNGLRPQDFTVWDGCDLFWRQEGERFVGRLKPGACRFASDAFGQEIVLEETLTLHEDRITFADRGLSLAGDYLFGMRGRTPNISLKTRPFLCDWDGERAWLHDQQGESDALGFPLRLHHISRGEQAGLHLTVPMRGRPDLRVRADPDADIITVSIQGKPLTCRHAPNTLYSEGR